MKDEARIRELLAKNITYYRKRRGLTQSRLAEMINYSDKSVSKWERAEGQPDLFVLIRLADIFEVTVNDLISETNPGDIIAPPRKKRHVLVNVMSVLLVWLIATIVFVLTMIIVPTFNCAWIAFIIAIPVSAVVQIVFSELWWNTIIRFVSVSSLIWSAALCIQVLVSNFVLSIQNINLIYLCAAIMQVLTAVWYVYLRYRKKR